MLREADKISDPATRERTRTSLYADLERMT